MQDGWSDARQAFVQHSATDVLDAALLRMTAVGFISARDPMDLLDLGGMERELVTDSSCNHDPAASPAGCADRRGRSRCARSPVSTPSPAPASWRRHATRREDADVRQHLGLYSEEIALTGEQIGNFPRRSPT